MAITSEYGRRAVPRGSTPVYLRSGSGAEYAVPESRPKAEWSDRTADSMSRDDTTTDTRIVQNTSKDGLTDISFTVPKADMAVAESIMSRVAAEIGAQGVNHNSE
ncbi:MAG: hypothetical protein ACKOCC_05885, partial [Actinomycetota bacterium]